MKEDKIEGNNSNGWACHPPHIYKEPLPDSVSDLQDNYPASYIFRVTTTNDYSNINPLNLISKISIIEDRSQQDHSLIERSIAIEVRVPDLISALQKAFNAVVKEIIPSKIVINSSKSQTVYDILFILNRLTRFSDEMKNGISALFIKTNEGQQKFRAYAFGLRSASLKNLCVTKILENISRYSSEQLQQLPSDIKALRPDI